MYEAFFGLAKKPFTTTPDPEFLFMTPSHREALAGLTYSILERKGFAVLTGEAGTGKTTILSSVIGSLHGSAAYFAWILNPLLSTSELFELALLDFGITDVPASKAQRIVEFQSLLMKANQEGKTSVLIVDEAHNLTPPLLEEIRLLTNFESGGGKLLQIVLAGQSELDALLERHDLRQLKQRISVRLTVVPLRDEQIGQYLTHRWTRAGATADHPFEPDAIRAIGALSAGVPRIINAICDNSLLQAFADCRRRIDAQIVMSVAEDLRLHMSDTIGARLDRESFDFSSRFPSPAGDGVPTFNGNTTTPGKQALVARWAERLGLRVRVRVKPT
jgi:general secretion pathway protein A